VRKKRRRKEEVVVDHGRGAGGVGEMGRRFLFTICVYDMNGMERTVFGVKRSYGYEHRCE
jgi:hypothetical protein